MKLSVTDSCAVFDTRRFNAACSQKWSSPMAKPWTLPVQWKKLIKTLNLLHKTAEPSIKTFTGSSPRLRERQNCGHPNHSAANCKFKDAECHNCGKKGHIAPACRSKPQNRKNSSPQAAKKTESKDLSLY